MAINQFCLVLDYISYYFERITDAEKQEGISNDYTEKFTHIFINPLASPCAGAPALKYGDVNTVTPSPGEVKGLMTKSMIKRGSGWIRGEVFVNK